MRKIVAILVMLGILAGVASATKLDYVDIGNTTSMTSHNALGWLKDTGLGNYGGRDGGSTIAMTWGELWNSTNQCDESTRQATIMVNTDGFVANQLVIRHLDGLDDDSFSVYADGKLVGTYMHNTTKTDEEWFTTTFPVSFTGTKTILINATGPAGQYCAFGTLNGTHYYGQLAINWVQLDGTQQIPEFTTVTALVALAGTVLGMVVLRRRK